VCSPFDTRSTVKGSIPLLDITMEEADSKNMVLQVKLTGQVPPLTILSKDRASGIPPDTPLERPDLSESLLLSYSPGEVTDKRPELGVNDGR
jgi:hypothetical protein